MSEAVKPFLPLEDLLPVFAGGGWHAALRTAAEHFMGLPELRRRSDLLGARVARGEQPYEAFFEVLGLELDAKGVVEAVPREGALVMIANHPLGGPDALAMAITSMRARPDVKVLGNAEVARFPGLGAWMLPLDILGGEGAARRNLGMLKKTMAHLREGGAVVIFPGGAVSHWQWDTARVEDDPWPLHTARIVAKSGAPVLPVRVFGQNGPLFQILGSLHPLLRSALIPRALLAMRGKVVRCRAGDLLRADELPADPIEMTARLRAAVYRVFPGDGN